MQNVIFLVLSCTPRRRKKPCITSVGYLENKLIREGRYTDVDDEVIIKVAKAKKRKISIA